VASIDDLRYLFYGGGSSAEYDFLTKAYDAGVNAQKMMKFGTSVSRRSMDRWRQKPKPPVVKLATALIADFTNFIVQVTPSNETFEAQTVPYNIIIGTEEMTVTSIAATDWTVTRRANYTPLAAHAIGDNIFGDSILRVAMVGDSVVQSTVGVGSNGVSAMLARILSRELGLPLLQPQFGPGFHGVWRTTDVNLSYNPAFPNSAPEWTAQAGAWTRVGAGSAQDKAPWGWCLTAAGVGNVIRFTVPAFMGSIRAADVYTVDAANPFWSYSINGGAFTDPPATSITNDLRRCRITSGADIVTLDFRGATAAGVSGNLRIAGVEIHPVAPTYGTTTGLKVYNFGKDSETLAVFMRTNASGDNLAIFDSNGASIRPDLVFVGPFTNDVDTWSSANSTAYYNNLVTIANRLKPYCNVVLVAMSEQNTRSVTNQQDLRNQVHQAAKDTGVVWLDMYDVLASMGLVGYAAANAEGLMSTVAPDFHYSSAGCRLMASKMADICLSNY
jgi:hypothetical protein